MTRMFVEEPRLHRVCKLWDRFLSTLRPLYCANTLKGLLRDILRRCSTILIRKLFQVKSWSLAAPRSSRSLVVCWSLCWFFCWSVCCATFVKKLPLLEYKSKILYFTIIEVTEGKILTVVTIMTIIKVLIIVTVVTTVIQKYVWWRRKKGETK